MESAVDERKNETEADQSLTRTKPKHKKKKKKRQQQQPLLEDSITKSATESEALVAIERIQSQNGNQTQDVEYCEWAEEGLGLNMFLVPNCLTSVCREIAKQSTDGARCQQGFRAGQHEFVFEFDRKNWGSHCAVGLGRKECPLHRTGYAHLFGQDSLSWAFDIPSGVLFHNGCVVGSVGAITKSDIEPNVLMKVNFESGSLCFQITVDHNTRACLYMGQELCRPADPLYPVVSMVYGLSECKVRKCKSSKENPNESMKAYFISDNNDSINQIGDSKFVGDITYKAAAFKEKEERLNSESIPSDLSDEIISEKPRISDLVVEPGECKGVSEDLWVESQLDVLQLPEDLQFQIVSYHGWDNVCRGGLIVPHPGAPSICVPVPRLSGSVQAVRCKHGFSHGRHRWRIKQLRSFKETAENDRVPKVNDFLVGVASSEHSVFNYGYSLTNVGPHVWCYQRSLNLFRHGETSCSLKADFFLDEQHDLELELDLSQRTLTFFVGGKAIGTVKNLLGNKFYPFLIFHKEAYFPVQMCYSKGPEEYIRKVLEVIENMTTQEKISGVFNHQLQLMRSSSPYLTDVASPMRMNSFHWGYASPGAKIGPKNLAKMSLPLRKPVILVGEAPVNGNVHKIQFVIDSDEMVNFSLGIVAEDFDADDFANGMDRYLGDCASSWGWNISSQKLFHANQCIATYSMFEGVDWSAIGLCRMTITYNSYSCSSVGFEIVSRTSGNSVDLGLAFVNIPPKVRPAVMVHHLTTNFSGSKSVKVCLEYYSGAWISGNVSESTSCVVL